MRHILESEKFESTTDETEWEVVVFDDVLQMIYKVRTDEMSFTEEIFGLNLKE